MEITFPAISSAWSRIEQKNKNRVMSALALGFFCGLLSFSPSISLNCRKWLRIGSGVSFSLALVLFVRAFKQTAQPSKSLTSESETIQLDMLPGKPVLISGQNQWMYTKTEGFSYSERVVFKVTNGNWDKFRLCVSNVFSGFTLAQKTQKEIDEVFGDWNNRITADRLKKGPLQHAHITEWDVCVTNRNSSHTPPSSGYVKVRS